MDTISAEHRILRAPPLPPGVCEHILAYALLDSMARRLKEYQAEMPLLYFHGDIDRLTKSADKAYAALTKAAYYGCIPYSLISDRIQTETARALKGPERPALPGKASTAQSPSQAASTLIPA